jgi:hypothetical protein
MRSINIYQNVQTASNLSVNTFLPTPDDDGELAFRVTGLACYTVSRGIMCLSYIISESTWLHLHSEFSTREPMFLSALVRLRHNVHRYHSPELACARGAQVVDRSREGSTAAEKRLSVADFSQHLALYRIVPSPRLCKATSFSEQSTQQPTPLIPSHPPSARSRSIGRRDRCNMTDQSLAGFCHGADGC